MSEQTLVVQAGEEGKKGENIAHRDYAVAVVRMMGGAFLYARHDHRWAHVNVELKEP